ncbi:alanine racemase [Patescibacteria group bacterium]|nr:alanine racemase [Patescibacteria group bacterium]
MQKNKFKTKSWVEISKKAIFSNISSFRKILSKETKIAAVIKANAYGHDIEIVSKLISPKVDLFAVDSIYEALKIRENGIKKPIIILGYTPIKDLELVIKNDISFACYNRETVRKIISLKLNKIAKVHLKIETGTNRQGLSIGKTIKLAKEISKYKDKIYIEGIYTHFANIEDTLDPSFAMLQLKRFNKVKEIFEDKIGKVDCCHCAASASTILYPSTHFNLIRLGISLYGIWPSKEVKIAELQKGTKSLKLKPVLSWKTIVAQVKNINKGESVSYGRTWTATKETKIAIIPIGYFDGFDRKLSNSGKVLIKGKYAQVIGRVAMNMFVVDVSHIKNVKVEDEVVIIGEQEGNIISADEIADKLGTINYEVICRINPLIPRIVI